jgi:hypothetical protein
LQTVPFWSKLSAFQRGKATVPNTRETNKDMPRGGRNPSSSLSKQKY